MKKHSIVYTNDNCIGCNKCIKVCSAIGACISTEKNGRARIEVDGSKCVACGSCIDVCVHGAREFEDDTERFFQDLKKGKEISILLAPAFRANYPEEYNTVLGGLRDQGVRRIINVSFGADICTWGYLNYIRDYNFYGGISQPCPAVVSYIERYLPELLPKLFPVQSPLMCAAIYARKELGITDRFAFISPCIAKKMEIQDPENLGLVQYNVTFEHLMKYVRENKISGTPIHSDIEYGLGSFYPTPGGLMENVKWFLGNDVFIRQIEGERHLYEWMHTNADRIRRNETPFLFIDALNCEKGCICGTAVNTEKSRTDDALYALLDIREKAKNPESGDAWSRTDTPAERLKNFNEQFKNLNLKDYLRSYTDRSEECRYEKPDEEQLNEIFLSMNKDTEESRRIDCTCCGYESCTQMATAIYNGFNRKENCIYYEKTMVQELEIEKVIAEEATQAKSSFLANMSHEIRTPINAMLGMNEMVLRECEDPNILAYSESIRSAGSTLLGLVNNILDFSKIEAGKMEILPAEYDLSSLLNDVVNLLQIRAEDKGLLISLDFDRNIPKELYGDELRIKQVISNLLTNAVKYTEKGTVYFRMTHEIDVTEADYVILHVSVEDTGIGIKPEDMEKLFSEFERIEEKRNRNVEGTGLGMNITQKLLQMMNSSLKVESTYGKGSKFSFDLRQKVRSWDALGDYQRAYREVTSKRENYKEKLVAPDARVLVVDDNPMNLMVFKSLLKQTRVKIDEAGSGAKGIALTRENLYDMIFLDHMMPEKDGIETLHELKGQEDNPNLKTPTVCLTANAISGAREQYIGEGFDDYLTKPIDSEKLERMLIHYLPEEKVQLQSGADLYLEDVEEIPEEFLPLSDSEWIDVRLGIKNSGSAESYRELLKIFYESIDGKTAELEECYAGEDLTNYTIKVHALKSSARIIGASELSEEAQKLENAGKAEDLAYIREHQAHFIGKCLSTKEPLKQFFGSGQEEEDLPEADQELMDQVFGKMREAAEDMDLDMLEEALDLLKGYSVPEKERELFQKVKAAADQFEYDAVSALLM